MSDLVEKVARALFEAPQHGEDLEDYKQEARAAIAAVAEWLSENGKPYEAAALRAAAGSAPTPPEVK